MRQLDDRAGQAWAHDAALRELAAFLEQILMAVAAHRVELMRESALVAQVLDAIRVALVDLRTRRAKVAGG
jgi:hypothetical protein